MPTTLYRKYRPQFFKELVGQNHIKITLTNELETERFTHAYLFCGPRGIGKTTTARLLAKALNCQKRQKGKAEPCNKCISCQEINQGRSLNIVEIDAASHTGVDNVRENIINNSRVAPVSSTYKVFIIDEVHMLSLSAFNALLKTLEEPPQNVVFILATTEIHKVPLTVISRCQRFDFQKVGVKDIGERLEKIAKQEKVKIAPKVLEIIALAAEGSVRDAESMLGQIFSLGEKEITEELVELVIPRSDLNLVIEFLQFLTAKDAASAIELVNRLVEEGVNFRHFIKNIIEVLRKIILLKVSSSLDQFSSLELDSRLQKELSKIVAQVEIKQLLDWLKIFLEKEPLLKTSSEIIQLPLEIAILEIIEPPDRQERQESIISDDVASPKTTFQETPENPKKTNILKSTKEVKKEDNPPKESKESPKEPKAQIKISDFKKKWNVFLKKLRDYNHSLALTLRVSEVMALENNVLTLGFGYRFYQDRVWEKKNKDIVEKVLEEVFNIPLIIKCTIREELRDKVAPKSQEENGTKKDTFQEALDTFGGEMVEE